MSEERHEIEYAWQCEIPLRTQADVDNLTRYCLNADECRVALDSNDEPLPDGCTLPTEEELARRRQHRNEVLAKGEADPYKAPVLESRMPPLIETAEQMAMRHERQSKRSERYWQRFHRRREERFIDAILGTAVVVKEPSPEEKERLKELFSKQEQPLCLLETGMEYLSTIFRAAEQINAGDMVRIDETGLAHRVVPDEGFELDTRAESLTDIPDESKVGKRADHSHLSAPEVIHEARIAAGCKPGESLIERCRELNAIRGESSPAEWKPCKLIYEAVLHHAEGLTDEDAAKWVGKPVLDETHTKTVGRVVKAERRGKFIVGTIEFYPGTEPGPKRTFLLPGEIVGPSMFRSATPAPLTVELVEFEGAPEPKQETWRDRPPLL